ncbi:aldose epimerase family protein [Flagellimonas sp. CMM7]|uniref:aldose epimerase family protein n=1 Tax=Flagellimonas sp. CMM7 TaxID=2654676 RepID=UPI0013D5D990|nr:aldose epimerase family protein [Flagellimonas sp. CMM7]UII80072.1 galactose mutarotase [Flagellimonas sp. CMM7]
MLEVVSISNSNGAQLEISNYGATILSLKTLDKNGNLVNVAVGLESPEEYTKQSHLDSQLFLGAIIGRYAGRISGGAITIENQEYPIHNQNGVHLHGGKQGFDKKFWNIDQVTKHINPSVKLSYLSEHLEENYPGNLNVSVVYELMESNSVKITYQATTDKTTLVNLTNHSYFNLDGGGSILKHCLQVHSDSHIEVDQKLRPTGNIIPSENTRFDFNRQSQIENSNFVGLDDTFVLKQTPSKVATLLSKSNGIYMNVYTNQPAMVIYTPKSFPALNYYSRSGYDKFPAICFEAQNFPDAPNHPHFPSSVLKPDQTYLQETIFEFKVESDL